MFGNKRDVYATEPALQRLTRPTANNSHIPLSSSANRFSKRRSFNEGCASKARGLDTKSLTVPS